ncbi:hypothetical protein ACWGJB_21025 [Streptomyces sp. NPDC054813]
MFPVLWIVVNALRVYRMTVRTRHFGILHRAMTVRTRHFGILRRSFGRLSDDPRPEVLRAYAPYALLVVNRTADRPTEISSPGRWCRPAAHSC